ncbi:metallophosphoesterase family protein [Paenibacillus antri]|nr:metallophosphoesterase [Paenibacillus antri]
MGKTVAVETSSYASEIQAVAEAVEASRTEGALSFAFITDLHHRASGNQLRAAWALRELSARLRLDFVLHGGDASVNGPKEEVVTAQREMAEALAGAGVPVLTAKGNHDDNSIYDHERKTGSTEHVVFPQESKAIWGAASIAVARYDDSRPDSLYFYADFPEKRVRVVVLDCIDHPYRLKESGELAYVGQWHYVFSQGQLEWLAHRAFDLRDRPEWSVLILSHVAILQDGVFGTDHPVRNGEALWDIVKAFRTGDRFRGEGGEGEFAYRIDADFAAQGARDVIGCWFGHVHHDQVVVRDGIPNISAVNAWTLQEFPESPKREEGSITETAFDIVTADLGAKVCRLTRFGAGASRTVSYGGGKYF